MNVQELIDELNKIEDKTKTVCILSEYGWGCFSESDDVSVEERDDEEDENGNTIPGMICINGTQTRSDSD
jgi:hypothetical protein